MRNIPRLYAIGGRKLTWELLALPWLCKHCAHACISQDVGRPRAFRALATHKVACARGLALPGYARLCTSFLPTRTTHSTREAANA